MTYEKMLFDENGYYIPQPPEIPVNPIPGKLLTTAGLNGLPEPSWLIKDTLPTSAMAWIAGAPGAFKSFMAIDWACAVSLGVTTCGGRASARANVIYMCCEGSGGLKRRVEAWTKATGLTPAVSWLPESVQIGGTDWRWLTETCLDMNVGLLVMDTYSRVTLGLDEIDGAKQGVIIEHLKAFRAATGATTLAVHHMSAAGKILRGHTSLEGDADTIFTMEKDDDGLVTMRNPKQKEGEQLATEYYRRSLIANSLTLTPTEEPKTVTDSKRKRA